MKAYKVLREKGRKRFSTNTSPLAQRYFVTKPTTPFIKGSKLFVFKRLEDAQEFRKARPLEIWEVKVPKLTRALRMISPHTDPAEAARFWKNTRAYSRDMKRFVPHGTYFASKLQLVKKVS